MVDPGAARPDVSVVVIVYNDARRLPTAVRSVLRQTLRSVEVVIADDHSTDNTPEVAAELQAEDPRVRYVRLPENSGGCGRPRNVGTEVSTGRTVMFLDSDDRLERHACKNLLEALEDNDADFSMGLVRRQYMDTGRQTKWYPHLFEERRVVAGLAEAPELIEDVLSVNKLFRREFLERHDLQFPEDVHYEDQVFSLKAYNSASRIAIIPENVYVWRIFPVRARRSITQQRGEITNFHHRLAVHRRLDAYLAEHGTPELQRAKDLKFLQNDMRLYLADVIDGDGTVTAEVLAEAEPYLRGIPMDRYAALPLALRAAFGMALRHDLEGLRQLMLLDRRNILASRVSDHDGTTYLSNPDRAPGPDPAHDLDAPENVLLVAGRDPIVRAPIGTYHLLHEVVQARPVGNDLVLSGRTYDALGKLAAADGWSLTLSARRADSDDRVEVPVVVDQRADDWVTWTVRLHAGRHLARLTADASWTLHVVTRIEGHESSTPLIWHPGTEAAQLPLPLALHRGAGLSGTLGPGNLGNTEITVTMAPGLRRKVTNRITKRYQPALEEQVTKHWRDADTAKAQRRLYQGWRQLPLDRRLVVFEANLGTIYGDSPKYVYEAMRRLHPQMKAVWVLPPGHEPPHPDVEVVERGTAAYRRVLARAAYWVDNQTFPSYIRKRPEQRYLQTWHGIPLKKMGHDEPGTPPPPPQPDRGVGAWDELCVPNRYFEETFVPAYRYAGGLVRYGTPRNDALVDGSMTQQEARRLLDLPQDARVVLYAPTFRQDNRSKRLAVEVPFDVEAFLEGMDDNTYLLLRPHYLNRIRVPASVRHRTLDTASVEDVNILYHAADVLVTDYSSVMFDYALLRKPIVFYTYDYGEYLATRGTYFDLLEVGPGPFVTTTRELVAAVASAETDRAEYAAKYQHFLDRYCGDEDGSASERAVRALLGEAGAP